MRGILANKLALILLITSSSLWGQTFEETPDIVISPDFCSLYPLTIPNSLMASALPGQQFNGVPTGTGAGNYSWLTWAGQNDVNTVVASLIPPGNSQTYINPTNPSDRQLNIGDWVEGSPGVMNASDVRDALDAFLPTGVVGRNIILPVWGAYQEQGSNLNYYNVNFAVVELTDYQLNGQGYISYNFKRFTRCYNHRPVALDDNVATPEDTPISFSLNAQDEDGNDLVYEVLTETSSGSINVVDNQVTYSPDENYNGPDQLTFIVHDNEQLSNIATVYITVTPVNDPPVADDKSASGPEDTPIDLEFTGSDIEQSPLSFRPVTQPSNGTLVDNGGSWQYQPNDDYFGPDMFTYVANDGELDSVPATYSITITPINDPPVANDIVVEVEAGQPIAITLTGSDVDDTELEFNVDSDPLHGVFTGTSPDLIYTSDRFYEGIEALTYRAFDGELYSEPASIEITVLRINEPPVIVSPPLEETPEKQTYLYPVIVEDPNDDPILYELDRAPVGMDIDMNTGEISWLPDPAFTQTVPTFNQQCYVVPTGSVKEYEEGDENDGPTYIAPLFNRVRIAIKDAGEYVAPEATAWHQRNTCLGCHIQTQSVLGLQSSIGKAEVDEAAADYLLNEILNSQQSDGTIRRSHREHSRNQTAFALWALSYVPDREVTFDVRARGLNFFWGQRVPLFDRIFWNTDHVSGWLNSWESMNALVTLSAVRFIIDSQQKDSLSSLQEEVVQNYLSILPNIAADTFARYSGVNENNNLDLSYQLITLGEIRKLVIDPNLLAQIDAVSTEIDSILRDRQLESGGWNLFINRTVADPLTSAWVGLALDYLNPSITDPAVNANIEFLLDSQEPNGTWVTNSTLFATRLATTSLVMAYLPVALEHLGNPDVRPGHIYLQEGADGIHQLSARVSNRGLAEITVPVDVNFYNGTPDVGNLLGTVRLDRINSGQELSPTIAVYDQSLTDDIYVTLTVDPAVEECEINNNETQAALVRVRATDPGDLFDTQIYTLNADDVNEGPEITSEAPTEFEGGQAFNYRVETQDGDIADAHIFSLVQGPDGLFIDPRTGVISAGPGVLAPGTYTIIVQVQDLRGGTATQTFTLVVNENFPPQIVSTPIIRGTEDANYQYDVDAIDPNPGDELTYTFENAPLGLTINAQTGLTNWLAENGFEDGDTNENLYCVAEPQQAIGQFNPMVKWQWPISANQILGPVSVGQLNDDNGDGIIDLNDMPDVVALGSSSNGNFVAVVDGNTGSLHWVSYSLGATSIGSTAIGDLDNDGVPEIYALSPDRLNLRAISSTGELLYSAPTGLPRHSDNTRDGVTLADLNGDGSSEIIVGRNVLNADGSMLWQGTRDYGGDIGYGVVPIAADVNLDGYQEVVAGRSIYSHDGQLLSQSGFPYDGFNAIGNFDDDDFAEIVIVGRGRVALTDHQGNIIWGPHLIPGGGHGGPPTVGDFDGDGEVEVGIAGARYYVVYETDGVEKWRSPTRDTSSNRTGSSLFDFESDGSIEVVYADEYYFRVYDGATGSVRLEVANRSGTTLELPVIADIDNDGAAEILVGSRSTNGNLRAFEDANDSWASTRSLWNQHAYSINNVNDDLTIPANPVKSWLTHNTFRLNTFPDRPALGQPDLVAHTITYDESANTIFVKVKNRGLAPVNSPITVSFVHEHFWLGDEALGSRTINRLGVGEELEIALPLSGQVIEYNLRVDLGVDASVQECAIDNNSARAALLEVRAYDPANLFDAQKFAISIGNINDTPEIISALSSEAFAGIDYSFQIEVQDDDKGESFEYSLINAPAGVTVGQYSGVISGNGGDLVEGVYPFTVSVRDVAGGVAQQSHILTISPPNNLPPEITSTPPDTVNLGEEYAYDVIATDPDGDEILFALSRTQPGMTINQTTGELRWIPTLNDVGVKTAEVTVVDINGAATKQYFLIEVIDGSNVNNQPPVIISVPSGVVYAGKVFEYQVEASDPDGDFLTYSLISDEADITISDTGLLSWLPDPSLVGQQVIVDIEVSDNRGGIAGQKLTLPVNESANHPPIITSVPALTATANELYEYFLQATDQDGDSFSFTLIESPNGMALVGNAISWTPSTVQVGNVYNVSIRVEDARGAASTQTFSIGVNQPQLPNTPPEISSTPGNPAYVDVEYGYDVIARDADGDALTYSLNSSPAGMTINNLGQLRWVPTPAQIGLHNVTVEVSDSRSYRRQSFTLQAVAVDQNNNFPEIISLPLTEVAADFAYSYQIEAIDADGDSLTYGLMQAPAGMTISTAGLIEWTPTILQLGNNDVIAFVSDGKGQTLQSYSITVADQPLPLDVFVSVTPDIVNAGDTVTINVFSSGGQGAVDITVLVDGLPVPVNPFGQTQITASGIGAHTIEVTVSDGVETVTESSSYSVIDPNDTTPPVVNIISPTDSQVITAPTDIIGSVQDPNLAYYRVFLAPKGEDFTEIARGTTEVTDDVLAPFDPTLLLNGIYQIAVEATDINGQVSTDSVTVIVDGDMKVGHFSLTFEDLNVDLAGIPIRVTRTYDTRQRLSNLDFGYGWSIDYQNVRIQESRTLGFSWSLNYYRNGFFGDYCVEPNGDPIVTVRLPDGSLEKFRVRANPECNTFVPIIDVHFTFEPLSGTYSTLEQSSYGLLRLVNGNIVDLSEAVPSDPEAYRLTTKDGLVYSLNENFGVTRVQEPDGQFVTFSDSGIQHSLGYAISFERDASNRITAIVLPDGRRMEYTYTLLGDLNTVTDMGGDVTSHAYLFRLPHYLEEIVDPRGVSATRMEYDNDGRLIAVIDADGNRIEYDHDIVGRTQTVRDRNGNQSVFVYDDNGRVVAETNALGETITRTYNSVGDILSETNDLGETTSWTYDNRGNQITETDALGRTTTLSYTGNGEVLTETDALGNVVVTNAYNQRSLKLESTVDALGNTTSFHWDTSIGSGCQTGASRGFTDAEGNLHQIQPSCVGPLAHLPASEVDATGVITTFTYDGNGQKLTENTSRTDDQGNSILLTTRYEYDDEDRVIAITYPDGSITQTEYNNIDQVTAEIDALGRRTEYEYDNRGNEIRVIYPDGSATEKAYDLEGNLVSETDQAGRTTQYVYDAANRQVAVILPDATPFDDTDNPRTQTEYDRAGRVSATVDARGNRTEYEYNAVGLRTLVRDALGFETQFEYDELNRRTAIIDARGNRTEFVYDLLGRVTETIYPDGTTRQSAYDAVGRKTSETDELGRTTQYNYDPAGRLIEVIDPLGNSTQFGYDEQGNKVSQIDAEGRTTQWAYDDLGRQISRTLPMGQQETFAYDDVGNRISHTDFNGATTLYSFDDLNRESLRDNPNDADISTSYTVTGQVATITDQQGTTIYSYDAQDRLIRIDYPAGNFVAYQYDLAGNRTLLTSPHGDTNYTFDELNRLSSVDDGSGATSYGFDAVGNRASVTFSNGVSTTYVYDSRNRLTRIDTVDPLANTVLGMTYVLNANGTRAEIQEDSGRIVSYSYDDLDRLTQESTIDPVVGNRTTSWTYDLMGNRLSETNITSSDTEVINYFYDDNDRLTGEDDGTDTTIYLYDANGNTLEKDGPEGFTSYTWNDDNRLVQSITPSDTVSYTYDNLGIRQAAIRNGVETRYLVDPNRTYAEVIAEEDSSGSATVLYTNADELVSQERGGTLSYYHADGLGSVRLLTNGTGSITDTYIYLAFGEIEAQTGSTVNDFLFTGEQFDPNLGFYYLRARYMDPSVGRFIRMDSWFGREIDPKTLHKYQYVHNNPITLIDPSGYYTQNFGYAVEKEVERQYKIANPHCIPQVPATVRNCLFGARAYFSLTRYLKPDIVDFLNKSFNEIKPLSPGGIASGSTQIKIYSATYGSSPFFFSANTNWEPTPAVVDGTLTYFFNLDGIIFYTDDDQLKKEMAAATLATAAIIFKNKARKVATRLGGAAVARAALNNGIRTISAANASRLRLSFGIGLTLGFF